MKSVKNTSPRAKYLFGATILLAATLVPARSSDPRNDENLIIAQSQSSNADFVFSALLSSRDSVQNVAGNYASNFPTSVIASANPYNATVAADEKGKLLAQGTIQGVTNSDGTAAQLDAKGTMKTQKGMSVASFKTSEKGISYNNLPVKASGSTALELVGTNAQILKAQGGAQQGAGQTAEKGRGSYAFGKKGATTEEFLNAPTNNTAGGQPWSCYFQVYKNEFGHYFATNAALIYYTYATNAGSVQPVITRYAPEWVMYSETDGSYSVNFYKPTNSDTGGDANAKWSVKKMVPFPTNNPAGTVSYKFLGQKGASEVAEFSYIITTNSSPASLANVTNGLPNGFQ